MKARAGGGDVFDMGDTGGGFDDDFKADPLFAALGGFNRRDQRIDRINVSGVADLGNHDLVQTVARLFQQIDDVAIPEGRVQTVDPDRQRLVAPINVTDCLNDVLARLRLVVGGDRIFKIQIDDIGG